MAIQKSFTDQFKHTSDYVEVEHYNQGYGDGNGFLVLRMYKDKAATEAIPKGNPVDYARISMRKGETTIAPDGSVKCIKWSDWKNLTLPQLQNALIHATTGLKIKTESGIAIDLKGAIIYP
jgi:hypothetical protein